MLEQEIFRALNERHDGRMAVSPAEALQAVSPQRAADLAGAARLQISRGSFPFNTMKIGGRRLVALAEIARVLAGGETASRVAEIAVETPARVKRGAHRKVVAVARGPRDER